MARLNRQCPLWPLYDPWRVRGVPYECCWSRTLSVSTYPTLPFRTSHCDVHILHATKDVRSSQEAFIDIFKRIQTPFKRVEVYMAALLTSEMMDMTVKVMVEVLSIGEVVTKEIKQ